MSVIQETRILTKGTKKNVLEAIQDVSPLNKFRCVAIR